MELKSDAVAGTMESSDIMITLGPGGNGIEIDLTSTVEKQFGEQIRRVIEETLNELGVESARVKAVDRGALDCAIRARTRVAACRSAGRSIFPWGGTAE